MILTAVSTAIFRTNCRSTAGNCHQLPVNFSSVGLDTQYLLQVQAGGSSIFQLPPTAANCRKIDENGSLAVPLENCRTAASSIRCAFLLSRNEGHQPLTGLKLSHTGSVEGKANYWLAWNGERLARSIDHQLLAKQYPDLHAAVLEEVTKRQLKAEKPILRGAECAIK